MNCGNELKMVTGIASSSKVTRSKQKATEIGSLALCLRQKASLSTETLAT